jgi:PKD repeat protein
VQFSALASTDPDGDVLSYPCSFGDGTPSAIGPSPTHTYNAQVAYTAALTVSDGRGGSHTTTHGVLVGPPACPVGQFHAQYYNNATLSGAPSRTDCESSVNNSWDSGAPLAWAPTISRFAGLDATC